MRRVPFSSGITVYDSLLACWNTCIYPILKICMQSDFIWYLLPLICALGSKPCSLVSHGSVHWTASFTFWFGHQVHFLVKRLYSCSVRTSSLTWKGCDFKWIAWRNFVWRVIIKAETRHHFPFLVTLHWSD